MTTDRSLLYRTTLAYQQSGSFRDFEDLDRIFFALSLTWLPSSRTEVHLSLEYKKDNRVAHFGIPAIGTRPAPIPISRYLGDQTDDDGRFDLGVVITSSSNYNGHTTSVRPGPYARHS